MDGGFRNELIIYPIFYNTRSKRVLLHYYLERLNTSLTIVVIQRRKSIVHLMMRYGKTK